MVSRTAPFPQLIAGFKSRPNVSPWLWPRGLYPQRGSYPCRPTCCPSDPSYLPPRLSSPSRILPSPSRSTVVSLAALRRICASADGTNRDGPGVLPDGLLVALRRIVRIETAGGKSRCIVWRIGLSMHARWRTRRRAYIVSVDRPTLRRLPNGSRDICLTGKIR